MGGVVIIEEQFKLLQDFSAFGQKFAIRDGDEIPARIQRHACLLCHRAVDVDVDILAEVRADAVQRVVYAGQFFASRKNVLDGKVDIDEVVFELRDRGEKVGRSTVYRYLEQPL